MIPQIEPVRVLLVMMMMNMTTNLSRRMQRGLAEKNVGYVTTPYLLPYVYNSQLLDKQYGIRNDGDRFKIGDFVVVVDAEDITTKEDFHGSEGLCELLTPKNVNRQHVTSDDLMTYKKILIMTNAHLDGFSPEASLLSPKG